MKTVAFHNLGCKVNSYEVDIMQQNLQKCGYKIVSFEQKADYFIINTCSVTNIADRKSRQMIHRAKKLNPNAVVVAVGCYVQADAYHIAQDPSVDLLVGNNKKAQIAEILKEYDMHLDYSKDESAIKLSVSETLHEKDERMQYLNKTLGNTTVADVRKVSYEDATMETTAEHTRAYIKIQDGCNRFCSYCIIPYTRGRVRSRSAEEIYQEIMRLTANGYKEFVITGIHISSYGIDFEKKDPSFYLIDLLKHINAIPGVERIRISSFEPLIIDGKFVEELKGIDKLCHHFHLSLQSGCDETLKRMNRRYTSGEYSKRVDLLRSAFPHAAITTDVIVGFPGETKEEFQKTVAFLEQIQFYEMHIFKYSKRKGTIAADMENQIPEEEKTSRSKQLMDMEQMQSRAFREFYIGKEVKVLFEEEKRLHNTSYWIGHTPEYVKVAVASKENLANTIATVYAKQLLTDEILLAEI